MNFIDKCRLLTKKGMKKNMKLEYRNALKEIKLSAGNGGYSTKFNLCLFYENADEMYIYIMDRLKSKGFKVEVENYGYNMSHTRLSISWK